MCSFTKSFMGEKLFQTCKFSKFLLNHITCGKKKIKSDFKERFHPNLCSIKSSECAFFTHLGLQKRGSLSSFSRIVLYYCLVKYLVCSLSQHNNACYVLTFVYQEESRCRITSAQFLVRCDIYF